MKKMKKFFAMFLALAMVLGMSVTAFAATDEKPTNPTHTTVVGNGTAADNTKGVITVKGIEDNATVTAYKIIEAQYNNKYEGVDHFSGYHALYDAIEMPTNGDAPNITVGVLTSIIEAMNFQGGVPANLAAGTSAISMTGNLANGYTASNVAVGSYLVVVTNAQGIYNPLVISVSYKNTGEALNVENTVLDITNPIGWAKASAAPTIDKTSNKTTVNIGDTVNFKLEVGPIPFYDGQYPVFNIEDNLSAGLTINANSVDIKVKDTKEASDETAVALTDYVDPYTAVGQKLAINFVGNKTNENPNGYLLNEHQGKYIVVTYSATVADKDAINYDPYTNTATLNYNKDSNVNKGQTPDTTNDKTYSYTFDLSTVAMGSKDGKDSILTKTGETTSGSTTPVNLPNAEFTLYTDAECKTVYNVAGNTYIEDGKVTSDENGKLLIRGLAAGNYWLKETKAPEGYSLNNKAFPIVISATYFETGEHIGQLETWTITFDGTKVVEGKDVVFDTTGKATSATVTPAPTLPTIPNTKLNSLPSTGGIGTTIFTVGGCAIMIIAAGLYFSLRRRTVK